MKVLLVDDHELIRNLVTEMVKRYRPDVELLATGDPLMAMEIVSNHPDIKVIVMDGSMSGYAETIRVMKDTLGKATAFVGVSCQQENLIKLGLAGCDFLFSGKEKVFDRLLEKREPLHIQA